MPSLYNILYSISVLTVYLYTCQVFCDFIVTRELLIDEASFLFFFLHKLFKNVLEKTCFQRSFKFFKKLYKTQLARRRCHNVVTTSQRRCWRCHNVARSKMRFVPTLVSYVVTKSLSDVVKKLPQLCCNLTTTLSIGFLGHFTTDYFDFFPFIKMWENYKCAKWH